MSPAQAGPGPWAARPRSAPGAASSGRVPRRRDGRTAALPAAPGKTWLRSEGMVTHSHSMRKQREQGAARRAR
jgi:hypothetical protein